MTGETGLKWRILACAVPITLGLIALSVVARAADSACAALLQEVDYSEENMDTILQAAKERDGSAIKELRRRIRSLMISKVDPETAEDLTQKTLFYLLVKNGINSPLPDSPEKYLKGMVRKIIAQYYRDHYFERDRNSNFYALTMGREFDLLDEDTPDPSEYVMASEAMHFVYRLPPDYRQIVLRHINGDSYEQIGRDSGRHEAAIRREFHNAVNMLQTWMSAAGYDIPKANTSVRADSRRNTNIGRPHRAQLFIQQN